MKEPFYTIIRFKRFHPIGILDIVYVVEREDDYYLTRIVWNYHVGELPYNPSAKECIVLDFHEEDIILEGHIPLADIKKQYVELFI